MVTQRAGTKQVVLAIVARLAHRSPPTANLAVKGITDRPHRESQTARKPTCTPGFLAKSITCSDQIIAIDQSLPNSSRTTRLSPYSSSFASAAMLSDCIPRACCWLTLTNDRPGDRRAAGSSFSPDSESCRRSNHGPPKSGIPNRKKTGMHTGLSCKIDYLLRSKSSRSINRFLPRRH